jgi:hypothetical protein
MCFKWFWILFVRIEFRFLPINIIIDFSQIHAGLSNQLLLPKQKFLSKHTEYTEIYRADVWKIINENTSPKYEKFQLQLFFEIGCHYWWNIEQLKSSYYQGLWELYVARKFLFLLCSEIREHGHDAYLTKLYIVWYDMMVWYDFWTFNLAQPRVPTGIKKYPMVTQQAKTFPTVPILSRSGYGNLVFVGDKG